MLPTVYADHVTGLGKRRLLVTVTIYYNNWIMWITVLIVFGVHYGFIELR